MGTWLVGWGLGLSVAAPIGPINVATLQLGLSSGFARAFAFGLGAATIDAVYCLAVYLGIAPLLVAAPWLRVLLYLAGAIMIGRMGWSAIRQRIDLAASPNRESGGPWRSYASGIMLTAVNPATILSWLVIGGAALSAVSADEGLILVIGIFAGSASWFTALALGARLGRRVANDRVLKVVSVVCGLALFGFAAVFGSNGLSEGLALIRG
ncbi:MAG: LysE family translocator [Anaerolineae bacterium]